MPDSRRIVAPGDAPSRVPEVYKELSGASHGILAMRLGGGTGARVPGQRYSALTWLHAEWREDVGVASTQSKVL